MASMYKKVNGKENILGWYEVKKNPTSIDVEINKIFFGFNKRPILVFFWIGEKSSGFFLEAFLKSRKTFETENFFTGIPIGIGMLESEEIGVFQILRDSKWTDNKKITYTSQMWVQILGSVFKFLKKKFLKASLNFHIFKNFSWIFYKLKSRIKNLSSILLEKKNLRNNLFFLYSSAVLKLIISIERVFIGNKKNEI